MTDNKHKPFVCPECGGTNPGVVTMVSTKPDPRDPWSHVLQVIECGECHENIPAHLAERWENQPLEEARREWQDVYRRQRR